MSRCFALLLMLTAVFAWQSALQAEDEHPMAEAPSAVGNDDHDHAEGEEHGHGEGDHGDSESSVNPNPLELDVDLALVTGFIFAVLLAVLWKFAWGPIMVGLQRREDGIAGEIAAAEARRTEAEKMLADYQRKLEQAGEEVRSLLDAAKKDAESMKSTIIDEAQRAASAEKDRATREIDAAKNAAIGEIAEHSVNWAFRVASDAVHREIKPDDHRGLIEDALQQFESKN